MYPCSLSGLTCPLGHEPSCSMTCPHGHIRQLSIPKPSVCQPFSVAPIVSRTCCIMFLMCYRTYMIRSRRPIDMSTSSEKCIVCLTLAPGKTTLNPPTCSTADSIVSSVDISVCLYIPSGCFVMNFDMSLTWHIPSASLTLESHAGDG